MSKRGLPETLRMRHDEHYVEALAASAGEPVGRMVPIELLDPEPEPAAPGHGRPVRADGLGRREGHHRAAHRPAARRAATRSSPASAATTPPSRSGLREVPVVIREVDDAEVMELALVENLQRKDLTAFEEAEALQQLAQQCGYTHEDMARKLGKSRTAITESLSLNNMPDEVRNLCRLADITAKSTLLQIVRQADPKKMLALVEKLAGQGAATRQAARKETAKPKAGPPEVLRLRVQAADEGVRPASELQEDQGREGRDHRSAREHHQRTARQPIGRQRMRAVSRETQVQLGRARRWR